MKIAAVAAVLVSVAAILVFTFEPPCLFHSLTGYQCPGCGSTRAARLLLQGEFHEAFRMNALFVLLLPVAAAGAFAAPRIRWRMWMVWVVVVVVVGWGVLRNV